MRRRLGMVGLGIAPLALLGCPSGPDKPAASKAQVAKTAPAAGKTTATGDARKVTFEVSGMS